MIALRKSHAIGRSTFWRQHIAWHGTDGPVDLAHDSHCLAYLLRGASPGDDDLYVMINGHWEDHAFTLSDGHASEWRRAVDTARPSPDDIVEPGYEPTLDAAGYMVRARSVVVLRRRGHP
jgi:glycogen operon protein